MLRCNDVTKCHFSLLITIKHFSYGNPISLKILWCFSGISKNIKTWRGSWRVNHDCMCLCSRVPCWGRVRVPKSGERVWAGAGVLWTGFPGGERSGDCPLTRHQFHPDVCLAKMWVTEGNFFMHPYWDHMYMFFYSFQTLVCAYWLEIICYAWSI